MKNKRGFTLIELLSVIVILAIIALIATPIVLNVINKSRKGAAIDSAYGYVKAIEYQNQMNELDPTKYDKISSGNVSGINVKVKGSKPDSGTVTIDKNQVISAELCINGYKIIYENSVARAAEDSSECRNSNETSSNSSESQTPELPTPENPNANTKTVWIEDVNDHQELCINKDGQDVCFKHNDYENEQEHLNEVIGNCQTGSMGPYNTMYTCENESYYCSIYSTNGVLCAKVDDEEYPQCSLFDDDSSCSRRIFYTATFKNGNTVIDTYKREENEELGTLPTEGINVPNDSVLLWYTEPNGQGTRISSTTYMPGENITYYAHVESKTLCKRATSLHTETCYDQAEANVATGACAEYGYYDGTNPDPSIYENPKGSTITYGRLGTQGSLTTGDAYDCDVNGDGEYDEETERFYYVSDLYKSGSYNNATLDSNYAVLIYYNSYDGEYGEPSAYHGTKYGDDDYHGPTGVLASSLPTTAQWNNVSLSDTSRTIYNENGTTVSNSHPLPGADANHPKFSYAGYAARLITYHELYNGCYDGTHALNTQHLGLARCEFLFENTSFSGSSNVLDSWVETPTETNWIDYENEVFMIANYRRLISFVPDYDEPGVHPAIEVAKTDMDI